MKVLFFALLTLMAGPVVLAQQVEQFRFQHLTMEDGLSQSSGNDILQDHEGYMWFSTQNGLNRYDGYNFTVFMHDPADSSSISSSSISVLHEDSNGNLWIGTTGSGLNLYNRDDQTFTHVRTDYVFPDNGLTSDNITAIREDQNGALWIGTSSGLNMYDRERGAFRHFFHTEGEAGTLSGNSISAIFEDRDGRLWIGTDNGLSLWDEQTSTFQVFRHDPGDSRSISGNSISVLYEDDAGTLWIGTHGSGLNRMDRQTRTFTRFLHDDENPYSLSGNTVYSLLEDSRGVFWVGTENEGLNRHDRETGHFYSYRNNVSDPQSLPHNTVNSIYENRDNILWIGTFSGGISYIDRKHPRFEHFRHDPFMDSPLNNNSVVSFLEFNDELFLVGTDGGGLNVFQRETGNFEQYRHNPEDPSTLSSDVILALHRDQEGQLWIGYYNGGVTRYDPDTGEMQHFRHDPQDPMTLSNDHVYIIYEDREGTLFFGTNGGGVNRLNRETGQISRLTDNNSTYNHAVIRAIYEDTIGNFWIGTYGGGILRIDKETGEVLEQQIEGASGLTSNVIMALHEDQNGRMWLGTREGGIHLFDRGSRTFRSYSTPSGSPSPAIMGILEDDAGNLWLSTLNGLAKFNPDDVTFENYGVEHGVQSREFNPLAFYKDSQGYMYFGGINGFNRFHPDSVSIQTDVPPVVLTDFKIFNRSVAIGEESPLQKHISRAETITIPHRSSVITFDFVTLNFNSEKRDRFAYILEGFDSEWNYVEQQRSATYTNLNPGEYTFRVRAANSDGVWGEADASVALIITPPFWRTTWFSLLVGLLLAGIITFTWQSRVRSITEQNRRLEEEVKKQTSRLFDKNKELNQALRDLKSARSELIEKAHKAGMADLATNVLHNVGNILNSVNISANLIDEIITNSRLKEFHKANKLLEENLDNLEEFILNDPKGKTLLRYYPKLEKALEKEHDELKAQKDRLSESVKLIVDVVSSQQDYSKAAGLFERVSIEAVVEDTLKLQAGSIERHSLNIETDYQKTDLIEVEKSKLIHTLVNLFKNAKEAMDDIGDNEKKLTLKTHQDEQYIFLTIQDTGKGIEKEYLGKVFNHGFTTKPNGYGFGLHSCANYMQEIGGDISVSSEGEGQGTCFILSFPKHSGSIERQKRSGTRQELIDDQVDL